MVLVAAALAALATALAVLARPRLPDAVPPQLAWLAAAAGAVALGLADTAPTGTEALDLVLRCALGFAVPLAAARSGPLPTAWLCVVSVGTLTVVDAPAELVAGAAAGGFVALVAAGAATGPTAAVAAAAALGPLAHVRDVGISGDTTAAIALGTLPVLATGILRSPRRARRTVVVALSVLVLLFGVGSAAGLLAALSARSDVDRGVDLAVDGIDLLGDDDDEARRRLHDAAAAFASAEDTLTTWWARAALVVPGVAQQSRAVSTMASAGADLARTAADATEDADVDAVRPRGGQVDLDALASLQAPLDRSVAALERADRRLADVDGPVLVAPVADRLGDLRSRVTDALATAELTSQAVSVAPQLLGADGPRRWFVAIQNPAELTGNGGFMGSWAEITTDAGRLSLTRSGRFRDLRSEGTDPASRSVEGLDELTSLWGPLNVASWSTTNFSPDHPTVAGAIARLYPQSGGQPVDGVIALTPEALAGFLEITGPVELTGHDEPLTAENAVRILEHEQYLTFPESEAAEERRDFLQDAVETIFDRLTEGDIPGPRTITEELAPAVTAGHLRLWSPIGPEQALFEAMGATGSASRRGADSFGLVTQNFNGNKIDWFLHRELTYDATWDPATGDVEATLEARIENRAPATGLPPSIIGWGGDVSLGQRPVADGENYMHVALYGTYPIGAVTVDGAEVDVRRAEELGHHTARFFLSVPSGEERVVAASMAGQVTPGARYEARPLRQPTPNPDRWSIDVRAVGTWRTQRTGTAAGPATERVGLVVDVARSEAGGWTRLRDRR